MKLPIPTVSTLESLSDFNSVGEVLGWAEDRMVQGIERILPDERISDGKTIYVVPGKPDD